MSSDTQNIDDDFDNSIWEMSLLNFHEIKINHKHNDNIYARVKSKEFYKRYKDTIDKIDVNKKESFVNLFFILKQFVSNCNREYQSTELYKLLMNILTNIDNMKYAYRYNLKQETLDGYNKYCGTSFDLNKNKEAIKLGFCSIIEAHSIYIRLTTCVLCSCEWNEDHTELKFTWDHFTSLADYKTVTPTILSFQIIKDVYKLIDNYDIKVIKLY